MTGAELHAILVDMVVVMYIQACGVAGETLRALEWFVEQEGHADQARHKHLPPNSRRARPIQNQRTSFVG